MKGFWSMMSVAATIVLLVVLGSVVQESEGALLQDKAVIKIRNDLDYDVYIFCEDQGETKIEELGRWFSRLAPMGGTATYRYGVLTEPFLHKLWCYIWHEGMWKDKDYPKACKFFAYDREKLRWKCEDEGCLWELKSTGIYLRKLRYEQPSVKLIPERWYGYCKDWKLRA